MRESFGVTHIQVIGSEFDESDPTASQRLSSAWMVKPAFDTAHASLLARERVDRPEVNVVATGWPMRCLWYQAESADGFARPALVPGDPGIDLLRDERRWVLIVLPLRPLWLGLLGNGLFYGALWLFVLSLPAIVRRMRRRAGRCARCGYTLKGISSARCPECGHATESSPA